MIDHDRLFKELLSNFFPEFVDLFLPDVTAYLKRESLRSLNQEIFTDVTSGERYEADLIVQAQFRGQESFFIIHLKLRRVLPPYPSGWRDGECAVIKGTQCPLDYQLF